MGCAARIARFCLVVVSLALGGVMAAAQPAPRIAGWWIAIDDTFVRAWSSGGITAMEELLIIDDDGRFENRVMGFWSVEAENCARERVCSDAPLAARGRAGVDRGSLSLFDIRRTDQPLDGERDRAVRALLFSASPKWTITRMDAVRGLLVLDGSGRGQRTFVRVEPDRLRRLRAGLVAAGLSAVDHWRCWVATPAGSSSASVLQSDASLPEPVETFVRLASWRQTLLSQATRPVPDDPDAAQAKLAHTAIEELMNETFADLPDPESVKVQRRKASGARYRELIAEGRPHLQARFMLWQDFVSPDMTKQFPATEVATARKFAGLASAEARQVFCAR